jgi:hypothetical protein
MTMSVISPEIQALIHGFTARLTAAVEAQTSQRIQGIVSAALAGSDVTTRPSRRWPAEPSKSGASTNPSVNKMSYKVLAVRKLQGKYIGALRRLRPGARNRVKKVAREQGVAAAVRLAQSLT